MTPHTGDPLEWMGSASCAQADPEEWFPGPNEVPHMAILVCSMCPVRTQCLDYAVDTHQEDGVWGGHYARTIKEMAAGLLPRDTPPPVLTCGACGTPFGTYNARHRHRRACMYRYADTMAVS